MYDHMTDVVHVQCDQLVGEMEVLVVKHLDNFVLSRIWEDSIDRSGRTDSNYIQMKK